MTDAAIDADYVDLKFIKSRKVCQVVVEIPIERGDEFVKKFGTPSPATGVPVALARLEESALKQQLRASVEKEKKKWEDMPRSQQAALACQSPDFSEWLFAKYGWLRRPGDDANDLLKRVLDVVSKKQLDGGGMAADRWDSLYSDYERARRGAIA